MSDFKDKKTKKNKSKDFRVQNQVIKRAKNRNKPRYLEQNGLLCERTR